MSLGSRLRANDGESKWVISEAHDEAIGWGSSGTDVFRTDGESLGVGRDKAVPRLVTSPCTNAATNGRAWAAMGGASYCHGTERKSWRKMAETGKGLDLFLRRDRLGQKTILDTLKTRRMAAWKSDRIV